VVMVENTEKTDGRVSVYKPVHPGANISKRGEDFKAGSVVLRKGDFLSPGKVGVAAALGRESLEVYAQPTVAIIPTGDEVAEVGKPLGSGQVYDINSHTLSSILRSNGCRPVIHGIVNDRAPSLKKALLRAASHDMVVLSGGSSAGERDVLEGVIAQLGEVVFHGVQIKPGKPTIFGRMGGTAVFGMPGYPTACLTNGYIFLRPAARKMARLPPAFDQVISAPLGKKYAGQLGRHQFLTVRLHDGEALPAFKESGAITSIAHADGWIEVPPNVDLIDKGTVVEVHLF
jgi:molybdopterin molybdotransferase